MNTFALRAQFAAFFAVLAASVSARAADGADDVKQPSLEIWAGADASSNAWLVYSGATVAPFGGIWENGMRLRAAGGYGNYRYEGERKLVFDADGDIDSAKRSFRAVTGYGEALIGYQRNWGSLTAKVFVGIAAVGHNVTPFDIDITGEIIRSAQGLEYGPKGVVELWMNLTSTAWTSLDVGYTTAHETGSARLRTGYRVRQPLSAGIEAIVDVNSDQIDTDRVYARTGAFLRYEWSGGELSGSAGLGRDWFVSTSDIEVRRDRNSSTEPYATVNWITHF